VHARGGSPVCARARTGRRREAPPSGSHNEAPMTPRMSPAGPAPRAAGWPLGAHEQKLSGPDAGLG
jgi:hypothetical protein